MTVPALASATRRTGAAPHSVNDWHQINWRQVNATVRRLQARIVKATQEGRWNKVKALQRLLTRSYSGKALAVRRVTENQGRRTPGVDGTTWDTPAQKATAVGALQRRGYQPRPLRRISIPKSNGKMRPLGIPTIHDRAMQALHLLALDPIAETTGDPNSYGFRTGRSPADAIQQCYTVLGNTHAAEWVLDGDIQSCFDRISHAWLLAHIPMDRTILRAWLTAGYMDKNILHATDEGTPQGGIISPVLANLTLDGLEAFLHRLFPKRRGKNSKVNLVRYADDFIITGASKALLDDEVRPLVEQFMRERGLELSPEKTVIRHISEGFDFLGQQVRTYNGKLLIKPSKKNVLAFSRKVRGIIRKHRTSTAGTLIVTLNPVIRGWANYHRHQVSKRTFSAMDHAIWKALWHWAKRRHPTKGTRWVKDKYWPRHSATQKWVFSGTTVDTPGTPPVTRHLLNAAETPIKRHIKIQGRRNPYDPADELYFEDRLQRRLEQTLAGKRQLLSLWKRQHGLCARCGHPLTDDTGWENHHRVWSSKGGSNRLDNRELLHPVCHKQVHAAYGTPLCDRTPSDGCLDEA